MVKKDPSNQGPTELADLFCRHARRRIEERFDRVFDNDDAKTYGVAQRVLRGDHRWLETGVVREVEMPAPSGGPAVAGAR